AVLLPLGPRGWASLCRAVTRRHGETDFALRHQLSADRDGLVVISDDTALLDAVARDSGTANLYVELIPGRGRERAQAFARAHGGGVGRAAGAGAPRLAGGDRGHRDAVQGPRRGARAARRLAQAAGRDGAAVPRLPRRAAPRGGAGRALRRRPARWPGHSASG